nr:Gfo/Idh/MocA family oxidoreductase [bacterium]MDZ4225820.1 Gfo/Idh/MocA family oxidoreductase [Candidatus Andersenbacteria bacterium]
MLKITVIGAGRWGQNIIATLREIGGVEVVVVGKKDDISPNGEKMRDADAVVVATPGSTHAQVALPFIEKGLPVFVEKPLAISLAEAEKMKMAADKSGALVFVGHIHLYNPAYLKTKELADRAGNIRALLFEGMSNGPYRNDMSAVWDWAPHDAAMALDLLGAKPLSVQAWGINVLRPETNLVDLAWLKISFDNAVTAVCSLGWLSPEKRKKLTVIAANDSIVFDDRAEKKVILYKNMGPKVADNEARQQEPEISYPTYGTQAPLERELTAFLDCVKNGKKPRSGIGQGVEVVRIIAAAERSAKLDGRIEKIR